MRPLAAVAAAITGIQVGASIVATRFVVAEMGPASLALLRYAIGFLCLLPPVLLAGRVRFERKDLVPMALLGIVQFGVLIALLNVALRFIPSGRTALLFASFPLMTMLIAAALGRERMTVAKTAGVLLTMVGVGLALGEKALDRGAGGLGAWIGEGVVLASAFAGALCSVLYRPYLRKYPPLSVSAFAMVASVGFLALLAAGEGFFAALPPPVSPAGWGAVAFIGIGSGIGYYLWLWSLGQAAATEVTAFLALSPVTATMLGASLLGEALSPGAVLGLLCVVAGLVLATRAAGAAAPPSPSPRTAPS
jgi:drug/metabolite transporter (DMT)-like permease